MSEDFGKDPDALYDDETVFQVNIEVMGDGVLKTSGDLFDKAYALACIDEARATIARQHERPSIFVPHAELVLKPTDVMYAIQIKVRRNGNMSVGGTISDKALALKILDNGRDAVSAYHNRISNGATVVVPSYDTGIEPCQAVF